LFFFRKKWRKLNAHNTTSAKNRFPLSVVTVGNHSYGSLNVLTYGEENILRIGDFCSIGPGCTFVLKADHPTGNISTFPFKVKILKQNYEAISKGDIIVDDDVWIGCNATVLSGVHIARGAIIAAGSVVSENVPPYAIVGGVPARVIKYRFSEKIIEELMKVDFKQLNEEKIKDYIDTLYTSINEDNYSHIIDKLFCQNNANSTDA